MSGRLVCARLILRVSTGVKMGRILSHHEAQGEAFIARAIQSFSSANYCLQNNEFGKQGSTESACNLLRLRRPIPWLSTASDRAVTRSLTGARVNFCGVSAEKHVGECDSYDSYRPPCAYPANSEAEMP